MLEDSGTSEITTDEVKLTMQPEENPVRIHVTEGQPLESGINFGAQPAAEFHVLFGQSIFF